MKVSCCGGGDLNDRRRVPGDQEHREVDLLFCVGCSAFLRLVLVGKCQVLLEITLPFAHRHGFVFVNAKGGGDVVTLEVEIGDDPELVKTLSRHQENQPYGSNFLHRHENTAKYIWQNMTFLRI